MKLIVHKIIIFYLLATSLSACSPFRSSATKASKNIALPTGGTLHAQLNWTAPSTGQPTGYDIEASIDNQNFTQIATAAAGDTSATLSGLSPVTYYMRVKSYTAVASAASQSIVVDLVGL